MKRLFSIIILIMAVYVIPVQAQTEPVQAPEQKPVDFFIAPLAEVLGYSIEGAALGAGVMIGAGNGVAMGLRIFWAQDAEKINTVEIAGFMRFYLQGKEASSGLFAQLTAGICIFAYEESPITPAEAGALSIGAAAGWRFPIGKQFYIEPVIRTGYPYAFGAGVSAGIKL